MEPWLEGVAVEGCWSLGPWGVKMGYIRVLDV